MTTQKRRGRPLRLPEDPTPIRRVHGGVSQRVAWLLATSRIHAADTVLSHRDRFVTALNGIGVAADQARVSRWESGNQRVPDRIVVAYEEVLGLAPGKLTAAVHGLRRTLEPHSPGNETVATTPHTMHRDLDRLYTRSMDHGTGADWLDLAGYLTTHPNIYLRAAAWTDVADQLVGETSRATGPEFTKRFEALRSMIRHPGGQRHVVKSIGAFVTDPDAQSVVYPLTLLQEVSHPRAQELVVQLLSTSSGMLQQGAAWVAATKLARGHFDEEGLRRLEGVAVLMIAAGPRSTPDVDIFDVTARLPEESRTRVLGSVRESASYPRLETMLKTGEVLPKARTREFAVRVATKAQELTPPPYQIEADVMLQRLIREALFHGHQERRHQAAMLLTVSPYSTAVAAALAKEVPDQDDAIARAAVGVLRYLATEHERERLSTWAHDDDRPAVRDHALVALGRLPGGLDEAEQSAVVKGLEGTASSVQRASIYALGMAGSPELDHLVANGDDYQRRAASWWKRIGPAIHEHTRAG